MQRCCESCCIKCTCCVSGSIDCNVDTCVQALFQVLRNILANHDLSQSQGKPAPTPAKVNLSCSCMFICFYPDSRTRQKSLTLQYCEVYALWFLFRNDFAPTASPCLLQYKNGGSTQNALSTLWEEGGVPRLYRGISFALVQGPLSRCNKIMSALVAASIR